LVGFIHCLLFGINPRHLTNALMAEYRKRIFDDLHVEKVKVYGPTPWIQYNPVKCVQKYFPPLPDAVSRSIINKRRGTCILNFADFKKVSEEMRTGRAAEQKNKKEARVKRKEHCMSTRKFERKIFRQPTKSWGPSLLAASESI
jgi:hypothetical protein